MNQKVKVTGTVGKQEITFEVSRDAADKDLLNTVAYTGDLVARAVQEGYNGKAKVLKVEKVD
jgi:hypothetical protein